MDKYIKALERAKSAYGSGAYDDETMRFIFPELRESDDENIREELVYFIQKEKEYMESQVKPENSPRLRFFINALAWLEKQKKTKRPSPPARSPIPSRYDELPVQKPAEWSRQSVIDALTKWLTEKIAPLHKKSLDGTITEREELFKAALLEMRSLVNSPDFQIGKDTPAEWKGAMMNGEPIPIENHSVDIPLSEWSEEDEKHINSIFNDFKQNVIPDEEDQEWLKNRFKFLRPQPKQEWSEKDEKFIKDLCNLLAAISNSNYVGGYYTPDLICKIKSLPPSWKPSNEQMYILNWVANILLNHDGIVEEEVSKKLQSLYNDLKKLM